jgi:hypothetical protein
MAGTAIGAIAMLAMAELALTAEAPNKDEVFKLTTAIQVPGAAAFFSFDISWVDPVLKRYFLADRNNKSIDVVDTTNNSITQFINPSYAGFTGNNDTSGPDGVLTVDHKELWVGDSPGKVWVLDASSGAVKPPSPISVGGTTRADELCYDPQNHVIMIASPGESPPYVTFISTTTYKVVGKLTFDGTGGTLKATNGLEQCGWSPETGKFYQNVPEVNGPGNDSVAGAVAVIDGKTMTVEKSFPVPLDACAGPQGMAIGPHNQILLGCSAPSPNGHRNSTAINAHSGAIEAILVDQGGADEVWFNSGDGNYFIPNCNTPCRAVPSTGVELLGIVDSEGHRLDQSVLIASPATTTGTGGARRIHSVAADPHENQVYVPIPAIGGGAPTYAPTLCSSAPTKVGTPTDAGGCIAVFTTKDDDHMLVPH